MQFSVCLPQTQSVASSAPSLTPSPALTTAQTTLPGDPRLRDTPCTTSTPPTTDCPAASSSEVRQPHFVFCELGPWATFSASGRIYHQSALNTIQCVDPRYRLALAQRIAQKYRDPDSRVVVGFEGVKLLFTLSILFSVVEQMAVTGTKVMPRATAPLTKPLMPAPATWWWAP